MGVAFGTYVQRLDTLIAHIDALESKGVPVEGDSTTFEDEHQAITQTILNAKALKREIRQFNPEGVKEKVVQLSWRLVGLKYKSKGPLGKVCQAHSQSHFEQLKGELAKWKNGCPKYRAKECTANDLEVIQEACRYPGFVKKLLKHESLRLSFFKWAIRDRNKVEVFVKFPATSMKLRAGYLTGRIGRYGGKPLKVEVVDGRQVLTLPYFDGASIKRMNILDPTKPVTLNNNWNTTVGKVLQVFAEKNIRAGDIEFVGPHGVVMNWNSQLLGYWNPSTNTHDLIDLKASDWLQRLPAVLELSKKEVEALYEKSITQGEWVVVVKASRHRVSMDIADTHGYLEIAMPLDNGMYRIYSLGKVAAKYPIGTIQKAVFLANTVEGKITIPDENAFFSHRQHAAIAYVISKMQSALLLAKIQSDLLLARFGNMVFQLLWESCASWPVELMAAILQDGPPNYYLVHALEADPSDPILAFVFSCVRKLPVCLQYYALCFIGFLIGYRRGLEVEVAGQKIHKSVSTSHFGMQHMLYHPAHLVRQVHDNRLQGTIQHGH